MFGHYWFVVSIILAQKQKLSNFGFGNISEKKLLSDAHPDAGITLLAIHALMKNN